MLFVCGLQRAQSLSFLDFFFNFSSNNNTRARDGKTEKKKKGRKKKSRVAQSPGYPAGSPKVCGRAKKKKKKKDEVARSAAHKQTLSHTHTHKHTHAAMASHEDLDMDKLTLSDDVSVRAATQDKMEQLRHEAEKNIKAGKLGSRSGPLAVPGRFFGWSEFTAVLDGPFLKYFARPEDIVVCVSMCVCACVCESMCVWR